MNLIVENGKNDEADVRLFFQGEEAQSLPGTATMLDVVMLLEVFESRGQAKKAGWSKPIQEGFSSFEIGKLRKGVWILNSKEVPDA